MPRRHYVDCPYSRKFDEIDVANTISDTMEYLLTIAPAYKHTSVAFIHQEGISNSVCLTGRPLCPSYTHINQYAILSTRPDIYDAFSMNMHRTSVTDTPLHVPIPRHASLSGMISSVILERLVFCRNVSLTHHDTKVSDDINPHSSMNTYLF